MRYRSAWLLKGLILQVLGGLFLGIQPSWGQSCQTCLMVTDPTASHSFTAGNSAQVSAANCGINVNSANSTAFFATGGSHITAGSIQVVGGSSIINGASASPTPTPAPRLLQIHSPA